MKTSSFSQELWKSAVEIYRAIITHPFVTGLADGSLDERKFRFYVIQDALYLNYYARTLSIAAAKAPKEEWITTFNEHAKIAMSVEKELHQSFFKDWGLSKKQVSATPLSPTNLAYSTYLIATAYSKPFHELLGALLPCYWIYWETGKELEKRSSKRELYKRWIDTYSSEEYAGICQAVLNIADTLGRGLAQGEKEEVREHFVTTSKYEYLFWDSAYKLERWLI